ncbi:hypothetical protein [Terrabacter carboxydivorans]|uniref:Uncharacterized protein n=1 Tax=Terrabacter carboxydivorans TaxID=619730 RepID=A0ABP5XYB2_9MICO
MTEHAEVIAAIHELDLKPRSKRWTSLTYCIVDAVWSIGARYDFVVVPVVRAVATTFSDDEPLADGRRMPADPVPLSRFMEQVPTGDALASLVGNRQRTSTRGGILKAEAVLRYAEVFAAHGVDSLEGANKLLSDPKLAEAIEVDLRVVPDDGSAGIRRSYLWMLVGDDTRIKPDRMVMRWLAAHGFTEGPLEAKALIVKAAKDLGNGVTPWMIDHAIWNAQRARR